MAASPAPLFPAALAQHTVESLFALHGRQRPWIYWLSVLGVSAAIGALPLVPVEVTVRSSGIVRPAHERAELRVAVGGRVATVLVHDNDRVAAGQLLLQLEARDVEERLARNTVLQREKSGLVADLVTLTTPLGALGATEGPVAGAEDVTVNLRTPLLLRAHRHFLAQLGASRLLVAKTGVARERMVALVAKGLVTDQERDDAQYAHARAAADLQLLVERTSSDWQAQLLEAQTAVEQLASENKRLQEELTLSTVRAPASGTVQGFRGVIAGTYLAAGQSLGYVSPDDRLRVETLVSPKDIGRLRVGQHARLQVDAYPYTQWGLLDGVVESVGADVTTGGAQAAFRVIVRPLALALHRPDGTTGTLRKGMTLTARFVVARRSLLEALYEDAAGWLDPQGQPAPE